MTKEINSILLLLFISFFIQPQSGLAFLGLGYTHLEDWQGYASYEEYLRHHFGIYSKEYLERLSSGNHNGEDFHISNLNIPTVEHNLHKKSKLRGGIFRRLFRGHHRNMGGGIRSWFAPTTQAPAMKKNVTDSMAKVPRMTAPSTKPMITTTKIPFMMKHAGNMMKDSQLPVVQVYVITSGNGKSRTSIGGHHHISTQPTYGWLQNTYKGISHLSFSGDPEIFKRGYIATKQSDDYRPLRISPRGGRINKGSHVSFGPGFNAQEHGTDCYHFHTRQEAKNNNFKRVHENSHFSLHPGEINFHHTSM
ncbi:uncharacterized protein LOC118188273 [Stegodyphus dumicola]|uniref:uncharacterized protein LOC118188273 n=1 Tax=Stegodyphus dumicola TaxID=202533 RepID=UPI0015A98656|nr:uncharacterized protein LOC118188273 [Stegodyphus dumicola]